MYCPSCGRQIVEGSWFCPYCESSIVMPTGTSKTVTEWEHKYFSLEFGSGEQGRYELSSGKGEVQARLFFWNVLQSEVLSKLQLYLDRGWQPITEVGPSALVFDWYNSDAFCQDWLSVKFVRIKMRRRRMSPLTELESKLIGKWRLEKITGRALFRRIAEAVVDIVHATDDIEFLPGNLFVLRHRGQRTGVYGILNDHQVSLEYDSPALTVVAELSSSSNMLGLIDLDGSTIYFRKIRTPITYSTKR